MRRWQAIPMAAIVALAVGAIMFTRTPSAFAGVPTPTPTAVEFYLDCGSGPGANCVLPSGTTTLDIQAKIKNNTGGAISLSALNIDVQGDNQAVFVPTAPACISPALDCNPDFNQGGVPGGFNCGSPLPSPDQNASGTVTESNIGCNTGTPAAAFLADGAFLTLATVHYTTADGFGAFALNNTGAGSGALAFDDTFNELGSCNPEISFTANCFGVTVQIGASAATNTPVPTSTNTPLPTATNTPCVGNTCPTATSEAFKTVTPTPGGETATPAPANTVVTGGETPAAPGEPGAPGGEQPGGDTGPGGRGPIRLPDTGSQASSSDGSIMLGVLATLGAGLLAGGLYFGVAVAADKRRREGGD